MVNLSLIKKWRVIRILRGICANWVMKSNVSSGHLETYVGSTHHNWPIAKSLNYINKIFDDYLKYSGLTSRQIVGKNILEFGPGDNLAIALKFLIAGAKSVVCLDKFYSKRDIQQEYNIYKALGQELNPQDKKNFDEIINFKGEDFFINSEKLQYIYGKGLEDIDPSKFIKFDIIVSRSVLEEIYDIDKAFKNMDLLLADDGYLIHAIDFRDYGTFLSQDYQSLEFFTIPEFIYRYMTKNSAKPNRRLIDYYENKMKQLGYNYKIFVMRIVGQSQEFSCYKQNLEYNFDFNESNLALVKKVKPRMIKRFRKLSDQQLLISGIFLVAKKIVSKKSVSMHLLENIKREEFVL